MALVKLENQAIIFPTVDCMDCESDCYCQPFNKDDTFYWQAQQTPCGDDIVCNGEFELGDELIENGTFDTDLSGWTAGSYVWSDGAACVTSAFGGNLIKPLTLNPGKQYVLTYTIKNYVTGSVQPTVYDTNGTPRAADGTYTETIIARSGGVSASLYFATIGTFCLDDISLKEVECWGMPSLIDVGWLLTEGKACHTPGSVVPLLNDITAGIANGAYYKITIGIEDASEGSVEVSLAGGTGVVIEGNGVFEEYIYGGPGTGFADQIIPTSDFDGCVTRFKIEKLTNDFEAYLTQTADDGSTTEVVDISSKINYYRQWVTIAETMQNLAPEYGCYRLRIKDVSCVATTLNSNCFCWTGQPNGCTKLVQGYSENAAYGFEFTNSGFRLSQRLLFALTSNDFPEDMDNYLYSNGARKLNFAQVEDYLTLFFESVPDFVHNCISRQRRLKHFLLGDADDVMTEYFAKPGAYQPEWVKNTLIREAPSRFDVRKSEGNIFQTNCE